MIDLTFRSINRSFVLSLENVDNDLKRYHFNKYYMPLEEIKYFNVLIDNKQFLDQPVKNKQRM